MQDCSHCLTQVLKKMLKAVEQLPICADDLHLTRSAHGTFADMLQQLTCHPESEVPPRCLQCRLQSENPLLLQE